MYAAKDNMNLPMKKTRTPLPSSPTPKFPSPAALKRHNSKGTEGSPTNLLFVDRDKRSPQNDPRIMDHTGSQNKAQQIIEFASSNIEQRYRGCCRGTALHCAERRSTSIGSTKPKHRPRGLNELGNTIKAGKPLQFYGGGQSIFLILITRAVT